MTRDTCRECALLRRPNGAEDFDDVYTRHTYASLLLSDGVSPVYVQQQLGHASIQITVDTYGKWIRVSEKAADRLDDKRLEGVVVAER